jgi:predicted lactoylglutathione lyase
MNRMIFVNLPVEDLPRSKAFYEALGFTNNPRFSDDTAACMMWSDAIFVMILTHAKWVTFTDRPIPDKESSEVALCLACESREEVAALTRAAGDAGGIVDVNPAQDHGFMVSRSFTDLDGHVWEPMWMDPAMASADEPLPAST